jgi:hypothetical protein
LQLNHRRLLIEFNFLNRLSLFAAICPRDLQIHTRERLHELKINELRELRLLCLAMEIMVEAPFRSLISRRDLPFLEGLNSHASSLGFVNFL